MFAILFICCLEFKKIFLYKQAEMPSEHCVKPYIQDCRRYPDNNFSGRSEEGESF